MRRDKLVLALPSAADVHEIKRGKIQERVQKKYSKVSVISAISAWEIIILRGKVNIHRECMCFFYKKGVGCS